MKFANLEMIVNSEPLFAMGLLVGSVTPAGAMATLQIRRLTQEGIKQYESL